MVIWVKIFKTEKTIEIHLVRLTEISGIVFNEKMPSSLLKHHCFCLMLLIGPPKQLFVYKQRPFFITFMGFMGRRQNYLPLTTNISQKLTQPSKRISYQVGDLCRHFTKQTLPSAYTLHSNPIPPTEGTNGFL